MSSPKRPISLRTDRFPGNSNRWASPRLNSVVRPSAARSVQGMDFQSMDGKPTYLFFLLVAPEDSAGIHLKALARISRLMKDVQFRKRLMEAESAEEIYAIFSEGDEKY